MRKLPDTASAKNLSPKPSAHARLAVQRQVQDESAPNLGLAHDALSAFLGQARRAHLAEIARLCVPTPESSMLAFASKLPVHPAFECSGARTACMLRNDIHAIAHAGHSNARWAVRSHPPGAASSVWNRRVSVSRAVCAMMANCGHKQTGAASRASVHARCQ